MLENHSGSCALKKNQTFAIPIIIEIDKEVLLRENFLKLWTFDQNLSHFESCFWKAKNSPFFFVGALFIFYFLFFLAKSWKMIFNRIILSHMNETLRKSDNALLISLKANVWTNQLNVSIPTWDILIKFGFYCYRYPNSFSKIYWSGLVGFPCATSCL